MKFVLGGFFENLLRKFKFQLKSDKNSGYFTDRSTYIFIASLLFLLRMRNVSDIILEKIKTHILCSVTFFLRKSCHFEIMSKNIVGEATDDNTAHAVH